MLHTIENLYQTFLGCEGVSTDSRADQPNTLFFALNGPNFKGGQFAGQALEKGARYAVVEDEEFACDRCLLVPDGLKALQQLALFHRLQLSLPVVGITGSNGKTTTKELINAVLRRKFRTLYTRGNLNNHIGVPVTLLSIRPEHELAIIEMGANHVGEIEFLCNLARPTHGLITNIGKAHLEGFGGIEGVARGKSELYRHLQAHQGVVFVNSTNQKLMELSAALPEKITYPAPGDYYQAELLETSPYVVFRTENGQVVESRITGGYNFENMAVAACIGKYFGVDPVLANEAIAGYAPANNRSQFLQKGSNSIILDAYNANPSSMAAAVQNFRKIAAPSKVLIAGDMLELGQESAEEHRRIGELIDSQKFDRVLLCGPEMKHARASTEKAQYFYTKEELKAWLEANPIRDSHILIKGSRGMGLETLVEVL
ncbi:UDP-N-acetylmuramoyl-tripeptide--D-alanyl-D-alanine ligase [soil metagenome]